MADPMIPAVVFNQDVVLFYDRVSRYIVEVQDSQSSDTSEAKSADVVRWRAYITELRRLIAWVQSQPDLDLPETHPRQFPLRPLVELQDIENDPARQLVRLFVAAIYECVNGQSARQAVGYIKPDEGRMVAILDRCDSLINDYIVPTAPQDLPESSPRSPMGERGLTGV